MNSAPAPDRSLQYPIGRFLPPAVVSVAERESAIADIAALPAAIASAVEGLNEAQLETPYREAGWTVRQVIHHMADSHMNAYVRMRLALTEDWPTIKPYEEARWAELTDSRTLPVGVSLELLKHLHRRWVVMLHSLKEAEWTRGYVHPESGQQRLDLVALNYSWHGRHHTAQMTALRERQGW